MSYELQAQNNTFSALVTFLLITSKCAALKEKVFWIEHVLSASPCNPFKTVTHSSKQGGKYILYACVSSWYFLFKILLNSSILIKSGTCQQNLVKIPISAFKKGKNSFDSPRDVSGRKTGGQTWQS